MKTIMNTSLESLANDQYNFLIKFTEERLKLFINKMKSGDREGCKSMVKNSPAGDYMGDDNEYIDMSECGIEGADIGFIINKLEELQKLK